MFIIYILFIIFLALFTLERKKTEELNLYKNFNESFMNGITIH